jgi:hypothetical protein
MHEPRAANASCECPYMNPQPYTTNDAIVAGGGERNNNASSFIGITPFAHLWLTNFNMEEKMSKHE